MQQGRKGPPAGCSRRAAHARAQAQRCKWQGGRRAPASNTKHRYLGACAPIVRARAVRPQNARCFSGFPARQAERTQRPCTCCRWALANVRLRLLHMHHSVTCAVPRCPTTVSPCVYARVRVMAGGADDDNGQPRAARGAAAANAAAAAAAAASGEAASGTLGKRWAGTACPCPPAPHRLRVFPCPRSAAGLRQMRIKQLALRDPQRGPAAKRPVPRPELVAVCGSLAQLSKSLGRATTAHSGGSAEDPLP